MNIEVRTQSNFSQSLLWFIAAISIAEIITGALISPLGLAQGLVSILIGHVIGGLILFFAGLIGAKSGLSSAESSRISFGIYGSYAFSALNILQLLGWTAVMVVSSAKALNGITLQLANYSNERLWCALVGSLICIWLLIGMKNLAKINIIVAFALLSLSLILGITVFTHAASPINAHETMSFGMAVELSVAMSLSWMPLISDYTRTLRKPFSGTVASVCSYVVGSSLMFAIGLGAAIYAGTSDVVSILLSVGLGVIAFVIVILSTVTTTFLDTYSAGVSATNFSKKINGKVASIIACIVGTTLAIAVPISQYESFLYLIGSIFAPIFAILFVDFYIFGKQDASSCINIKNSVLWLVGFIIYRLLLQYTFVVGITLPVMIIVGIFCYVANNFSNRGGAK